MLQSADTVLFVRTLEETPIEWLEFNTVSRRINKHFDCIACRQRQSDHHDTVERPTIQWSRAPILCMYQWHYYACNVTYVCIPAVQYLNQEEDQYRHCLLSNPLIHMYIPCMYVCMTYVRTYVCMYVVKKCLVNSKQSDYLFFAVRLVELFHERCSLDKWWCNLAKWYRQVAHTQFTCDFVVVFECAVDLRMTIALHTFIGIKNVWLHRTTISHLLITSGENTICQNGQVNVTKIIAANIIFHTYFAVTLLSYMDDN